MIKKDLLTVTSSNLFCDSNFMQFDEDGLLSQRIFGPVKSYKCACGKLDSEILYKGKNTRCDFCGVLCTSNEIRYKTFGKISLPFPIYKPSIKNKKKLRSLVKNYKHLLDTTQADLSRLNNLYLKLINDNKLEITEIYNDDCVPLIIKGQYTLYLSILYASKYNKYAEEIIKLFNYDLLVLPPKCRPVIFQSKNNIRQLIKHEINDYYISALQICKYDWKIIKDPLLILNHYITLIDEELEKPNPIPITDDLLSNYDISNSRYQYYMNKIYELTSKILSHKKGLIRGSFLGKSIDFSSRAHITIDPSLAAYEIKIPKSSFIRLWFLEYLRYLSEIKKIHLDNLNIYVKKTEIKNELFLKYIDEFIQYFFESAEENEKLILINRQPTLSF